MAAARGEKLLTASDLATLCEVDLKTIHNWVERGRIAHFRTPGRHLRFRAADVADFLRAWGYAVPRELARAGAPGVLVVGSKDAWTHVQRAVGEGFSIRSAPHPYDALVSAGGEPADVYVVDLRSVPPEVERSALFEALHRAGPQATLVALGDENGELPDYVHRVGRSDAQALAALIVPPGAAPPDAARGVAV